MAVVEVVLVETQPLILLPLQAEEGVVVALQAVLAVLAVVVTLATIRLAVQPIREILAVGQVTATMVALELVGGVLEVAEVEHPPLVRMDKL